MKYKLGATNEKAAAYWGASLESPTITPPKQQQRLESHWRNKNWKYQPSTTHGNSAEFRARMEKRRKEAQEAKPQTTEIK